MSNVQKKVKLEECGPGIRVGSGTDPELVPDVDVDPDIGPGFSKIVEELRNKKRYDKNKCLNGIKYSERLKAQQILDKKIVDVEYEIRRAQVQLRQLKEKRDLFSYYDDGTDPY
jgi:hypothetical protein